MARFGIDWELPRDWTKAILSEVAEINPPYRVKEEDLSDGEIPFVPMASVPERGGVLEEFERRSWQQVKSGKTRFREGDTLFAKITPCTENGKVAFIESLPTSVGFGSTEFHVISPGERLVPKFLFHFLRTQWVRDNAIGTMIGTTNRQRIPSDFFKELEIPLPPIAEQARIVAKLDRIQRALKLQREALQKIDALMQSALHRAFRGEL